jgi:hypothetical protein
MSNATTREQSRSITGERGGVQTARIEHAGIVRIGDAKVDTPD